MNIGYSIKRDFERPSKEIIDKFTGIPVPNIGDCGNRTLAIGSDIRPVNNVRLQGPAYTVRVQAGDNLLIYYAIDNAKPGDIIVVDGNGFSERALIGEIMTKLAMAKHLGGMIIYGAIRDSGALAKLDFPVFYKSISPNGPYKNGPGEINVPVNIGGKIINPGDILVGDIDGLVVIDPSYALEIIDKAHGVMDKEAKMMANIEEKGSLDLAWMYKKLEEDKVTFN